MSVQVWMKLCDWHGAQANRLVVTVTLWAIAVGRKYIITLVHCLIVFLWWELLAGWDQAPFRVRIAVDVPNKDLIVLIPTLLQFF